MFRDQKDVELILSALGDQLEDLVATPIELLVCGGSALNILGLVQRTTDDVDILAIVKRNTQGSILFVKADPLSSEITKLLKLLTHEISVRGKPNVSLPVASSASAPPME